jgi:hypothetical protein
VIRSCRYVGAYPDTLENGRPLAPGDTVDADIEAPHNALLVDAGRLVVLDETPKLTGKELEARGKELEIEGFSSMTADEKRDAIAKAEATTTQED